MISGHRRKRACELAGIKEIPAIVRNMSNEDAIIYMVDSNKQRERILPSEKAFAYKMKLEAMKRQGQRNDLETSSPTATKLNKSTAEIIGADFGEGKDNVYRYIRLTELIPELLQLVDDEKMKLRPAVEISYLTKSEQEYVFEVMEYNEVFPSHPQARELKKLSADGNLTDDDIDRILSEEKPNQKENIKFSVDKVKGYFPKEYTPTEMQKIIVKLLENYQLKWQKEKELKKKYEEISNRYPKWIETNQDGKPLQTIENCIQILENSKEYQGTIAFNEFSNRIMINHTNNWTDFNYSDMVHYMERNFKITNENKINHAFKIVAQRNKYHPIRDYLNSLTWDGIERVNRVFIEFLGAHDTIYSQKVSAITFIGAVSRVFNPGVKYDTMPVFVGKQGIGKSKFIRKIAVNPDWFTDGVTTFDGKEFYESIQGKWLIELGEGTAFQKSIKERSKQAIASQQDFYREPYARNPEVRKRQCIFFGTTNNYDFLKDETGDRRYYPIDVNINRTTKNIDNDLNSKYINQLWAEAVYRYNQNEEIYITDTEILRIAEIEQKAHFDASPIQMDIYNFTEIMIPEVEQWYSYSIESRKRYIRAVQNGEDTIKSMCMRGAYKRDRISIKEIACELYGYELNQPIDRKFSLEISRTLTSLGWNKSGKTIKLWHS